MTTADFQRGCSQIVKNRDFISRPYTRRQSALRIRRALCCFGSEQAHLAFVGQAAERADGFELLYVSLAQLGAGHGEFLY